MSEVLDSGHVVTDEDVDTARLIMELDRALGRPTDPLTKRVATAAPTAAPSVAVTMVNGHRVPGGDALARAVASEQNAAELAREVGEQLPDDLDPAEQARVVSKVQDVIHRRMVKLVSETNPGH